MVTALEVCETLQMPLVCEHATGRNQTVKHRERPAIGPASANENNPGGVASPHADHVGGSESGLAQLPLNRIEDPTGGRAKLSRRMSIEPI
jgi:hypothetical protein